MIFLNPDTSSISHKAKVAELQQAILDARGNRSLQQERLQTLRDYFDYAGHQGEKLARRQRREARRRNRNLGETLPIGDNLVKSAAKRYREFAPPPVFQGMPIGSTQLAYQQRGQDLLYTDPSGMPRLRPGTAGPPRDEILPLDPLDLGPALETKRMYHGRELPSERRIANTVQPPNEFGMTTALIAGNNYAEQNFMASAKRWISEMLGFDSSDVDNALKEQNLLAARKFATSTDPRKSAVQIRKSENINDRRVYKRISTHKDAQGNFSPGRASGFFLDSFLSSDGKYVTYLIATNDHVRDAVHEKNLNNMEIMLSDGTRIPITFGGEHKNKMFHDPDVGTDGKDRRRGIDTSYGYFTVPIEEAQRISSQIYMPGLNLEDIDPEATYYSYGFPVGHSANQYSSGGGFAFNLNAYEDPFVQEVQILPDSINPESGDITFDIERTYPDEFQSYIFSQLSGAGGSGSGISDSEGNIVGQYGISRPFIGESLLHPIGGGANALGIAALLSSGNIANIPVEYLPAEAQWYMGEWDYYNQ